MALMAAHGDLTPMPDAAIFADTKAEPASVYKWLDWLEKQLPFPVHRVSNGNLTDAVLEMRITKDGRKFSKTDLPLFTLNQDGSQGKIMNRICTIDYKIKPILRKAKELMGHKKGSRLPTEPVVTQWIGISLDEVTRMKPSRDKWAENIWPLIDAGMSRHDCKRWMEKNGYPEPPRSACIYCPFHNNVEWRRLKKDEPKEFERAVEFERDLQRIKKESDNFYSRPHLHRSLVNLDKVDFSTMEDRGQLNFFENECEGMCGV
jgi:hypothetical protein